MRQNLIYNQKDFWNFEWSTVTSYTSGWQTGTTPVDLTGGPTDGIAIGNFAGGQGQGGSAVAIGNHAAEFNQGQRAIAIGSSAGINDQGQYSIAIGQNAGYANQAVNSIILNATGANTQIQFNDGGANFGGNAGFTFDKVTGQVDIPGDLIVVGNISANNLAGNANYANFAGTAFNVSGSNVSGAVANATFALDAGTANIANIANTAATVTTNAQPNITSLGNLTSLSLNSNNIALGIGAYVALEIPPNIPLLL